MLGEFRNLDLHYSPGLTGISTGTEALRIARENSRVNLIITTPHLADMDAAELARADPGARGWTCRSCSSPGTPASWPTSRRARTPRPSSGRFLWQGDARILVSIVKSVEDWRNAEHDTGAVGVQVIILVEDNVRYYSSFLPVMYTELLHHSQRVIAEGLNLSQKILRMRARPKILLCTTWEEAGGAFERYRRGRAGHHLRRRVPARGRGSRAGGRRLRPTGAGRLPGRADHPALLAARERGPRPQRRGRLPPQGVAAPPPGAARRDARALRLRRLRLPPAGRHRGGPRGRPPGPRGEARHGAGGVDRPPRRPQPLLALAQGPHRVRARPRAAAAHARRLREPAGAAGEPHPGDRLLPARAEPHAGHGLRPRRLRPVRRLLPDGWRLAGRQGARPRLRAAAAGRAGAAPTASTASRSRCRSRRCSAPTSSTASWTTTTCATSRSSARTTRRSSPASAPRPSRRRRSGTWRPSSGGPPGPSRCAPRACSRTRSTSRSPASTTR